jgi:hypothetical protein
MKTLDQLKQSVLCENLTSLEFKTLLNSEGFLFHEGWNKDKDYIFCLNDYPKTIFLFSDVDGYSLGIVTYQ